MQFRGLKEINLGEVDFSEMTDGAGVSGTFDFPAKLPSGFLPMAAKTQTIEAFIGQTTVGTELGVAADPNAFLSTKDVVAKDKINATPGGDIDVALDADTVVRLTVTGNASFAALTAGKVDCSLWCIDMNSPETVETD